VSAAVSRPRAFSGSTESAVFSLCWICDSTFVSNRHGGCDGKPYSQDLHERVIAAVDTGTGACVAALLFQVSVSYIYKALIRRRKTGEVHIATRSISAWSNLKTGRSRSANQALSCADPCRADRACVLYGEIVGRRA
jgi:hypothetical protein